MRNPLRSSITSVLPFDEILSRQLVLVIGGIRFDSVWWQWPPCEDFVDGINIRRTVGAHPVHGFLIITGKVNGIDGDIIIDIRRYCKVSIMRETFTSNTAEKKFARTSNLVFRSRNLGRIHHRNIAVCIRIGNNCPRRIGFESHRFASHTITTFEAMIAYEFCSLVCIKTLSHGGFSLATACSMSSIILLCVPIKCGL
jgi:hypothetical protein